MPENRVKSYLLILPVFIGLITVHYFALREDALLLCSAYSISFIFFLASMKYTEFKTREIVIIGLAARALLLFSLPNLSDDFYRFIWDGRLINLSMNPYAHTPEFYMQGNVGFSTLSIDLFNKLNSQAYFTIYPPISQVIFWISAALSPNSVTGSVNILRIIILAFEIGNLVLLIKLLKQSNLGVTNALIYGLNPLVVLELTGNLHFEGVMIFFLLGFIYLFQKHKIQLSALAISLGIATKLIPLMFLPFVFKKTKISTSIVFYVTTGIVVTILFVPFLDLEFLKATTGSIDLFFRKFEFNGGLFFLFREIGFYRRGFDMIAKIGPWMSLSALFIILAYAILIVKKTTYLPTILLTILFIQLSLATTVHPWYIIPLIAFAALSKFKFPILWSFFIFLTYSGYSAHGFDHPFLLIGIEYLIVIPMAIYEIVKFQRINYLRA
jgi:alpha-1,6-mannosyltransferase